MNSLRINIDRALNLAVVKSAAKNGQGIHNRRAALAEMCEVSLSMVRKAERQENAGTHVYKVLVIDGMPVKLQKKGQPWYDVVGAS